jgi:hypothetical protein
VIKKDDGVTQSSLFPLCFPDNADGDGDEKMRKGGVCRDGGLIFFSTFKTSSCNIGLKNYKN